ncbi:MAG: sigma-70 family RNA polymerase sigma factor [Flavobacterium sp.]
MSNHKDLKTFEDLYKEHFVFLCLVSFNITKDKDVAKDVVQDFFIYMWEKESSTNFSFSFKAYATKAIKNLSLQQLQKNKTISLETPKIILPKFEEQAVFEEISTTQKPRIYTLVDKIPLARREIFMSHVVEGHSYAEIAEIYNISINTVKTQMKRAYAFLREFENTSTLTTILYFLFRN